MALLFFYRVSCIANSANSDHSWPSDLLLFAMVPLDIAGLEILKTVTRPTPPNVSNAMVNLIII